MRTELLAVGSVYSRSVGLEEAEGTARHVEEMTREAAPGYGKVEPGNMSATSCTVPGRFVDAFLCE